MAINVRITKQLDNDFVQVEATARKKITRNYKVPKASADSFCKEYQNNNDKMQKKGNIIDFIITPASAVLSLFLAGKTNASKTLKLIICMVATMAANYTCSIINNNKYIKQKQDIVSKYNATEIDTQEDAFGKVLK